MNTFTAVVEKDFDTNLYVGSKYRTKNVRTGEKEGSSVCVMQWRGVIRDGTLI
ncbi:hypothetical protein [Microcystis aeruginosa]|uniref:hypothetical protein n=1 Tax=Microcystis aeruginosa TaxID=1126 RepID=UPI001C9947F5|nr:hypothetical protein [Microcystis aeruginosa]